MLIKGLYIYIFSYQEIEIKKSIHIEKKMKSVQFQTSSPIEKLNEIKIFLEHLNFDNCELVSDHHTNYIMVGDRVIYQGIHGILLKDKPAMMEVLNNTMTLLLQTSDEVLDATLLYERGVITSL